MKELRQTSGVGRILHGPLAGLVVVGVIDLSLIHIYPVNPFRNGLPDEAHWRAHMRADIALLLACDYIYMLKDWELSKEMCIRDR